MGKEGRGKELGGEKKGREEREGRTCPETPLAKHHFSEINLNNRLPPSPK